MSDFMRWLYANYIKPQISEKDDPDYEMSLSLMDTTLDKDLRFQYQRTVEFYCIRAFLLGLRTGTGLSRALKAGDIT